MSSNETITTKGTTKPSHLMHPVVNTFLSSHLIEFPHGGGLSLFDVFDEFYQFTRVSRSGKRAPGDEFVFFAQSKMRIVVPADVQENNTETFEILKADGSNLLFASFIVVIHQPLQKLLDQTVGSLVKSFDEFVTLNVEAVDMMALRQRTMLFVSWYV